MKAVIAGLILFATLDLSPAHANDLPADVSVKGDYARISMHLGDRLRGMRVLAEDCRRETRDWAKVVEADEKSKSSEPPSELPVFGRRYDISSITGNNRYVSVIRMSATEIDDVYNATEFMTFVWDSKANKRIGLARFFNETADQGPTMTRLLAEAIDGLVGQIGKERAAAVMRTLRPSLEGIGPASLAPSTATGKNSGLNFHYLVPAPGIFHLKPVDVFVPWTKFKRHLSPQGRSIFGGNWRERDIW